MAVVAFRLLEAKQGFEQANSKTDGHGALSGGGIDAGRSALHGRRRLRLPSQRNAALNNEMLLKQGAIRNEHSRAWKITK